MQGLGDYEVVSGVSQAMELFGRRCKVLSLEGLIRSKRAAGKARDLEALTELEALREMGRKPAVKPDGPDLKA